MLSSPFRHELKRAHRRARRAFSLMEMVVIVIVIGLLATIATVGTASVRSRSSDKAQTVWVTDWLLSAQGLYAPRSLAEPGYTFTQALLDTAADLPVYAASTTAEPGSTMVQSYRIDADTGSDMYSTAPNHIVVKEVDGTLYLAVYLDDSRAVFGKVTSASAPDVWIASCQFSTCDAESASQGRSSAYAPGTTSASTVVATTTTVAGAPSAPTISSVTASSTQLTVNFTAPASNGGAAVTNYQYSVNNGSSWQTPSPSVTSSPLTITGLTSNTPYQVRLRAVNSFGNGTQSAASSVSTLGPPSSPAITSITASSGQLTVNFTAPTSTGGSAITNYQYSTDNGAAWSTRAPSATTSPLVITGLENGVLYPVQIRAVNALGAGSASATASATPSNPPGAPTISSITTADEQLSVLFSSPASNGGSEITNYEYSTDNGTTWTARTPASVTSPITISDLLNGTSYNVKIRAVNDAGSGTASAMMSATPSAPADAPSIASIASGTSGELTVNFTAPASNGGSAILNYQYTTDGGTTWTTRSPVSTSSPLNITGLTNGTSYQVAIRAVNSTGSGSPSATISATAYTTASAPTVSSLTPSPGQLAVNFSSPASNGGSAITNYQYSTDNGSTWTTRSPVSTASPLNITGLTNGTSYTVKIRAVNEAGNGTASTGVSGYPYTTPGAPTITSSYSGTLTSGVMGVHFTAGSSGGSAITNYQYSTDNGTTWTTRSPASTASPLEITGLSNGSTYNVKIRAVNTAGNGTASNTASQLVYTVAPSPSVSAAGVDRGAYVSWSSNGNGGSAITSAWVEYTSNGGSTWTSYGSVASSGSATILITGLASSPVSYTFRVSQCNAAGCGLYGASTTSTPWSAYLAYQEAGWGGSWQITSQNGAYTVILQSDWNLVEYGPSGVRWAFVKGGCYNNGSTGAYLGMQGDTNLVLYCMPNWNVGWASSWEGKYGYSFIVQSDGYVCLRSGWFGDGSNTACW